MQSNFHNHVEAFDKLIAIDVGSKMLSDLTITSSGENLIQPPWRLGVSIQLNLSLSVVATLRPPVPDAPGSPQKYS